MNISDYVKEDWLLFSSQNNLRSLPSFKDGQITTTRKLLFALKNQKDFEVVERLGLHAAAATAYKNGGASISNSLAGMVKSYPGTNNVPMFDGEGQFGTAIDNDASEVRYISAKISENFRDWFRKEDDDIYPRRISRGDTLEYLWMAPVAPLSLVNGSFGIGTGYAANIYQHHPLDVIEAVIAILETGVSNPLVPCWIGWKGKIEKADDSERKFFATGTFERVNATTLRITELPPMYTSTSYTSSVLVPLLQKAETVLSFSNDSNKFNGWDITVNFKRGTLSSMTDEEVINLLQIRKSFSHVLFGWGFDDKIKGYDSVDEILFDWVMWRVDLYRVRKNYLLNKFIQDIKWTELKLKVFQSCIEAGKFIESVIKNHVTEAGYTEKEFNTLMDTPVRSVTDKGIEKLKNVLLTLKKEQKLLQAKNPEDIMLSELKELKATVSIKYPR